ncbi:hypothetical protein, partial [Xanthobacter aminoxidans]|uniref:hypothetical protein n=1 Tax=Xanthobacter aminoxidans TaxID=186280 RepID=UPI00372C1FB0
QALAERIDTGIRCPPSPATLRSFYRAWLACHDDDPQRLREEWTTFGEGELTPEHPFRRSDFLSCLVHGEGYAGQ